MIIIIVCWLVIGCAYGFAQIARSGDFTPLDLVAILVHTVLGPVGLISFFFLWLMEKAGQP